MLKQVHTLQQTFKFENDRYASALSDIGFEQSKLVTDGGQARYRIEVISADLKTFVAQAVAVVDFDEDGVFNVWTVDESGVIKEKVPD
jgi:type IV pilus assembly protein PilE